MSIAPGSTARPNSSAHHAFDAAVRSATGEDLRAARLETVQVNVGLTCNLACHHCHVVSGPQRPEQMTRDTLQHVLELAQRAGARTIDVTGGAPEMNPNFRWFVAQARARGHHVLVRTNLTILLDEGYTDLPAFFRDHQVHLIASLPCFLEENVDRQRGRRVYGDSIAALRALNAVGYGRVFDLPLDLVYNPLGPHLPPSQAALEEDYRRVLRAEHEIGFTRLIAITNMPIGRFVRDLERQGAAEDYDRLLREAFNPATTEGLMCRHQVHVAHDGTLHDCDFNYALGLAIPPAHVGNGTPAPVRIQDVAFERLARRRILTGAHCFGCTAGAGSSCGGALA